MKHVLNALAHTRAAVGQLGDTATMFKELENYDETVKQLYMAEQTLTKFFNESREVDKEWYESTTGETTFPSKAKVEEFKKRKN